MSKLVYPARKCFVSHLKEARKCHDVQNGVLWKSENNCPFALVWIQGMLIEDFVDNFILEDSTGRCEILKSSSLSSTSDTPERGYVMVVGELLQNDPAPIVKAIKVQDLSNEEMLQMIWPFEVRDMQNEL